MIVKNIKKYIPELESFDKKSVHEPHQKNLDIKYAKPVVEHSVQRQKALQMFEKINNVAKKQH